MLFKVQNQAFPFVLNLKACRYFTVSGDQVWSALDGTVITDCVTFLYGAKKGQMEFSRISANIALFPKSTWQLKIEFNTGGESQWTY